MGRYEGDSLPRADLLKHRTHFFRAHHQAIACGSFRRKSLNYVLVCASAAEKGTSATKPKINPVIRNSPAGNPESILITERRFAAPNCIV
jgi:hypothetical protein